MLRSATGGERLNGMQDMRGYRLQHRQFGGRPGRVGQALITEELPLRSRAASFGDAIREKDKNVA